MYLLIYVKKTQDSSPVFNDNTGRHKWDPAFKVQENSRMRHRKSANQGPLKPCNLKTLLPNEVLPDTPTQDGTGSTTITLKSKVLPDSPTQDGTGSTTIIQFVLGIFEHRLK